MRTYPFIFLLLFSLYSCQDQPDRSDAYGHFEATVITISAEAKGRLLWLDIAEGQNLRAGKFIGLVDTTQLHLQRKQLQAQLGTLPQQLRTALADIAVIEGQKANLIRERDRVARLLTKKAATPKQLDDLNGEISVVEERIEAVRSQTRTANRSILSAKEPILAQIDLVAEQIRRSYIYNPVTGSVLNKLAEAHEMVNVGTPLYRIGQLDTMRLRVYASAVQLQEIKVGQEVEVLIDQGANDLRRMAGTIGWIADQAEFTPKTVQTKEERVNLVYAIEIRVPNPDGLLKIGMPGEVNFAQAVISQNETNS